MWYMYAFFVCFLFLTFKHSLLHSHLPFPVTVDTWFNIPVWNIKNSKNSLKINPVISLRMCLLFKPI